MFFNANPNILIIILCVLFKMFLHVCYVRCVLFFNYFGGFVFISILSSLHAIVTYSTLILTLTLNPNPNPNILNIILCVFFDPNPNMLITIPCCVFKMFLHVCYVRYAGFFLNYFWGFCTHLCMQHTYPNPNS